MDIKGKTRIFKKEFGDRINYSTSIAKKNEDGTYDHMYISVQLPKGTTLENKTEIDIKKGFLSFYKSKEGQSYLKMVVQEYEISSIENIPEVNVIDDGTLPF